MTGPDSHWIIQSSVRIREIRVIRARPRSAFPTCPPNRAGAASTRLHPPTISRLAITDGRDHTRHSGHSGHAFAGAKICRVCAEYAVRRRNFPRPCIFCKFWRPADANVFFTLRCLIPEIVPTFSSVMKCALTEPLHLVSIGAFDMRSKYLRRRFWKVPRIVEY